MTDDQPMAQNEDAWKQFEADAQTVVDHIQDDAGDWDVLGVDLASDAEDGRILFLLVIRRKVSQDGNLLLSERYYRFDTVDREGSWLSNGIERRVNGSLPAALRVLYAASTNGDADPDDPMLLDSREDGLQHHPETLQQPVRDLDDSVDEDPDPDVDPRMNRAVEAERTPDTVTCDNCGAEVPRSEAKNIGAGIGVDLWVHDGVCDVGGDDDE